ncbi:uncharacterized protein L3040_007877 [Drepanopeziza brunnea f. sp. 'multigermtubi']|uniref:SMODS and SLOG-associating 2TM effector domain-containing protein n=1 Tax=Marssonina brunnea f. sp. multigermtubi (strain MB_m1) TaxID=1072389 RepID=K1WZS8_MARBU|nr:uncharacterized protein MBM_07800 [Drepanopeziza brunnea f. sp. 'multigermtubi' MB_m1]EKD14123.1 hypothetical protein MBM_07800 [Drepanopeziza brunnea f. sp. 'multigermtubi' MB_m1]KAJ5035408.1 hypothetical protein L3040_007877 [Drepanopeziza brunnea f. sp. 'multigermtubi']
MSSSSRLDYKTMDSRTSEENGSGPPAPSIRNSSPPQPETQPSSIIPPVTVLSPEALAQVRHAIGAPPYRFEQPSTNSRTRIHKRVPNGLYKTVLQKRRQAELSYYFTSAFYNTCLVLQILLGALLTALGSSSNLNGTAITILAAANTVNAGLLALLHNSGIPGRTRNDWNEYDKVEMFLLGLMDSGIVQQGMTTADVIQTCFNKYSNARATVERNQPSYYASTSSPSATGPGAASTGAGAGESAALLPAQLQR